LICSKTNVSFCIRYLWKITDIIILTIVPIMQSKCSQNLKFKLVFRIQLEYNFNELNLLMWSYIYIIFYKVEMGYVNSFKYWFWSFPIVEVFLWKSFGFLRYWWLSLPQTSFIKKQILFTKNFILIFWIQNLRKLL